LFVLSVCAQGYPIGSESIYGKTIHFDGTRGVCLKPERVLWKIEASVSIQGL
jgi:hypothetical protein